MQTPEQTARTPRIMPPMVAPAIPNTEKVHTTVNKNTMRLREQWPSVVFIIVTRLRVLFIR